MKAIGHLLHNYSQPESTKIIIFEDENKTSSAKPQGGTGKGVIIQGLKQMRDVTIIDGQKFDPDNRFNLQSVKISSQIVVFDDVKLNFRIDRLNSAITEGIEIEKKGEKPFHMPLDQGVKLAITSNHLIQNSGTSRKRRQYKVELSDYYSRKLRQGIMEPIIEEHGCAFFGPEWNKQEWNAFDSFMIRCGKEYLKSGLHPYQPKRNLKLELSIDTNQQFADWIIPNGSPILKVGVQYENKTLFEEFQSKFEGCSSQTTFTKWIKKFAEIHNLDYGPKLKGHSNTSTFTLWE